MTASLRGAAHLGWALALASIALPAQAPYQRFLTGSAADVTPPTQFGLLLSGGGGDVDEAFGWFLARAAGGDIVILRASGSDGYHRYLPSLGPVDSVETFVTQTRQAAFDAALLASVHRAEGLFLAGGDQWNYVRMWKDTPLEDAIHALVQRGAPVGGSSAGLAVLGEFLFSARHDTVTSQQALADPYHERVTVETGFLRLPFLERLITDSHFGRRDRMGRTLVFLARMLADHALMEARALGIDERTAVLVDGAGEARVAGAGSAYLLDAGTPPAICQPGAPLTLRGVRVHRVTAPGRFRITDGAGTGAAYEVSVEEGVLRSTQPGGAVY